MRHRVGRGMAILALLVSLVWIGASACAAAPLRYLFIGHPRSDLPGGIVQREVERIDYSAFDLVLLGGHYTLNGTGSRQTVAYLDAIFDFASPSTLAALGNHDTANKIYFTDASGRPRFYARTVNGITFVILDTTDDSQNILGAELQMLTETVAALPANSQLVIVHHHILWLTDNAINCEHYGDNTFIELFNRGAEPFDLSGAKFNSGVGFTFPAGTTVAPGEFLLVADNNRAAEWATSDQLGGNPGQPNIPPPWLGTMTVGTETTSRVWHGVVPSGWYLLDSTPDLLPADWQPAGTAVQATSTSITLTDPSTLNASRRFFRLSRLFPR
jgi:Lamin Tail Domain